MVGTGSTVGSKGADEATGSDSRPESGDEARICAKTLDQLDTMMRFEGTYCTHFGRAYGVGMVFLLGLGLLVRYVDEISIDSTKCILSSPLYFCQGTVRACSQTPERDTFDGVTSRLLMLLQKPTLRRQYSLERLHALSTDRGETVGGLRYCCSTTTFRDPVIHL